ncbi:ComEA family DNA-binding protein [Streptomyces sp. NRRL F-5123]|uniref:ComEA family DNA-binding protein n=1 Tax=Streptomyces sp. NRRL F-5123 TaxID=1463856 RepID=UPI002278C7CB|nr:ComEA family DNA-binding protein [Streptomyces sp. NRRL F-5123]
MNVMSATRATKTKVPREASEAEARTRERASAIFPAAGPPPPPPTAESPPGARFTGVRTWLLLRCGLELRTVAALTVVLLAATGLAVRHYMTGRPHTVRVPAALPPPVPAPGPSPARPALTVDIAGKVASPGLRHLPPGSRVADALTAAGGPLPGTDTTSLNLARPLTDGEQLLVGQPPPPASASSPPQPGTPATPLSLNSATAPQLDALPGVGPVLAQHILDYRTQHGAFTTLQQLRQVPGIGDRKFTTLKPLVHP